jgi:hypothetical protein
MTVTPILSVVDADGQPVTGEAANLTLSVITDGVAAAYGGSVSEVAVGQYAVTVTAAGVLQSVCGVSSTGGSIVIPAAWRNQMDLVNAPNATAITAIQAGLSTLTAAQVWAYSTRKLSSFGTLVADIATAVWAAVTRTLTQSIGAVTITSGGTNVVDGKLEVEVPRGDSYSLVLTAVDADGVAVDLSSYNTHTLTVKAAEYRADATDTNKLFQATGTLSGAGNNVLTFALTPAQTVLGDLDVWYDCDVESSNTLRTAVRTVLVGRYRSTLDVTRGS